MKILKLKFKNINSLAGEHEIDFTSRIFTDDGLFAISGKTGAGKSSILDAISLALFGQTPRVNVTGSENPLLTRGERDCSAEVVFEVAGKKWKSSFKQALTRTGNLRQVERQIADENDVIVAERSQCNKEIENILGLNFQQFKKVVMLAQGEFAALLQAKAEEKGELLEQITGTEIYAEISVKVFERNREEKAKLDKINADLEAIKDLSPEEIQQKKEEIVAIEAEKKNIDGDINTLETARKWLAEIRNVEEQIKDIKQRLPQLEEKSRQYDEQLEQAELRLRTAKEQLEEQQPIFTTVRVLDTKIAEKENPLRQIMSSISDTEKNVQELNKDLDKGHSAVEKLRVAYLETTKWIEQNSKLEELVAKYAVLEQDDKELREKAEEIKKAKSESATAGKKVTTSKANVEKATQEYAEKEQQLNRTREKLEQRQAALKELLGGREIDQLRQEREDITDFGKALNSLYETEKQIVGGKNEIEDISVKLQQYEKEKTELLDIIHADKQEAETLEKDISLLDENIKLTKTIQSLEEHRRELIDGEPCPLCGAAEHPFALGNIPHIGNKEKELADAKKYLQKISTKIVQDEKHIVTLEANYRNASEAKKKAEKILSDNREKRREVASEVHSINPTFVIPEGENRLEEISAILEQKREELKTLTSLEKKANESRKEIARLRDQEIPTLQADKEAADKMRNEAEKTYQLLQQEHNSSTTSLSKLEEQYTAKKTAFQANLAGYGAKSIDEVAALLDAWKKRTDEIHRLEKKIQDGEAFVSNKKDALERESTTLDKERKKLQELQAEKQILETEREQIFGHKSVEEEESILKKTIQQYETHQSKVEKEKHDAALTLERERALYEAKEKELHAAKEKNLTDKTQEEIEKELLDKKAASDELAQELGAKRQILNDNAQNSEAKERKRREKEEQQRIANKWAKLDDLIGSSTGKKYRNFAQALTFEHLVALANRHLLKMSDRYLLKRVGDPSNPFELFVIDKFQNNEERTVQNLSGGEKFIVSLALALGLSNMAGKNMRIDTMFIDEGFGTLDSDYLDVALNALSNLQNDGKIIGIISHVTELKERIATHIEVVSSGNGRSKVLIPRLEYV